MDENTSRLLNRFSDYLQGRERSPATVEKYCRDVRAYLAFAGGEPTRENALAYKTALVARYHPRGVNSRIAALNACFRMLGREELCLRQVRTQRAAYLPEERCLTREEYFALLDAAERQGNARLLLTLQAVCATGIRIGELPYVTVEAAVRGEATVFCKGKMRRVLLPTALCERLLAYATAEGIAAGPILLTACGRPVDRSNVWREMKTLALLSGVEPAKVFPHNLRHLFARCFYEEARDIVRLADVLGHTSIDTTRIYLASTGKEHRRTLERLALLK